MLSVKLIEQETRKRQKETKRPSEKNKERERENRGFSIDCVE